MIRSIESSDRPAVRALQTRLQYSDPNCIDAAIDGPFVGRVAIDHDRVVGYAVAFPGTPVTLSELVVATGARREGHGRRLVESIVSTTRAERIVVTTPSDNREAKRFYTDLGFEYDDVRTDFYADGTDALRLSRSE